jgi:hypothetical protein
MNDPKTPTPTPTSTSTSNPLYPKGGAPMTKPATDADGKPLTPASGGQDQRVAEIQKNVDEVTRQWRNRRKGRDGGE